ncbi:conserved domain protein [Burkholderia pseudomallei MSHR346]|nr:conserved domain protein [Burkholderia pseudomallei MSHR346]
MRACLRRAGTKPAHGPWRAAHARGFQWSSVLQLTAFATVIVRSPEL